MKPDFTRHITTVLGPGLALLLLLPQPLQARIKLVTLPPRERVEVQLDHEEVTLVEEERIVPLTGTATADAPNEIDFSWANT